MKKIIKKYKWIKWAVLGIIVTALGFGAYAIIRSSQTDAMFYEAKCYYKSSNIYYSLIVDDKKSATEFKKSIDKSDDSWDRPVKCELISYASATDDTLFVYSVMTVLKDVIFAFKEYPVSQDYYQVRYFNATEEVVALSCQYQNSRFNCYDNISTDATCPETEIIAYATLGSICDHKTDVKLK